MSLKDLKTDVVAGVKDLATLEVASFTGSQIALDGAKDDNGEYTSKVLFDTIRKALPGSTLVGYSKFEVDGDSINYLNTDLGEGGAFLIDGHNSLVEGAQSTRKSLFDFVINVIREIRE